MFQVTYGFNDAGELKSFVDRNMAFVGGAASPAAAGAAAGEKRGPGRPPGSGAKPATAAPAVPAAAKITRAQVNAALGEVKDRLGTPAAKELIAEIGFQKMNDITEEKFQEAYDKAKAALEAPAGGESNDEI